MSNQTTNPTLPKQPTRTARRSSGRGIGWLVVLALLAVLVGGAYVGRDTFGKLLAGGSDGNSKFQTHLVQRGLLRVTVTEDGNVESAKNVDIKCMVEGGSTILYIVEEGTQVKEGDLLVRLDSALIEEQLTQQRIAYEQARSTLIMNEEAVAVAEIAVKEYLQGTFEQELQLADANIVIAKENLKNSQNMLDHSKRMFRKGYINQLQLESNRFAVERSQLELNTAETARKVLVEFTKVKMVKELQSAVESAQAQMLAQKAATQLEQTKLERLEDQLAKCTIKAPATGMVIYAQPERRSNSPAVEEGANVRQYQDLILLPDLSEMQVKVLVHETKVNQIEPGLSADIRIRDWRTAGTVTSVGSQPEPGSWFSSDVKEYATLVRIDDTLEEKAIKPGMTAEVEIIVSELPDVLSVPLLGVVEMGGKHFCYVAANNPKGYEKRPVVIGKDNDQLIEIKDGLNEGDRVILNPRSTIEEARQTTEDAVSRKRKAMDKVSKRGGADGNGWQKGGPQGKQSEKGGPSGKQFQQDGPAGKQFQPDGPAGKRFENRGAPGKPKGRSPKGKPGSKKTGKPVATDKSEGQSKPQKETTGG